jgi:tetratricopeptide (TPR) repeat protein
MRYFRKRAKLSSKAFGELYGKEVNTESNAIAEGWIREMETQNKVPVDITKRKTIARLLKIPPVLFGLAVLEESIQEPHPQTTHATTMAQSRLPRVAKDTTKCQSNVQTIWQMHDTGNAQGKIGQLYADIHDLEGHEQQAQGDLRYHVQEILLGDQLLATHIVRDQRQFSQAYHHANEAVRVAKSMNDSDLLATALFTRGWTCLEWGLFGTIQQDVFQVRQNRVNAALRDFDSALEVFPPEDRKDRMHPQLRGCLTMYRCRAQAALTFSKGEKIPASLLLELDDIADTVGKQNIDDVYTRALVTGTRKSWHQAGYLSTRATAFHTAGLPGQALKELNALESLIEKTYRKDETRQFAWLDILRANIYMGLEEFGEATKYARRALLACQDINSVTNMAIITDIYGRLLTSSYKTSSDVHEIGGILRKQSAIV